MEHAFFTVHTVLTTCLNYFYLCHHLSVTKSCPTLCDRPHELHTRFSCPSLSQIRLLLRLMSIQPSILCGPLLSPVCPSIGVFSIELAVHIRWSKYWSFQLQHQSFSEHSGLISFRMDWFDLLAVQGNLKSFPVPQLVSILWLSAFFMVQLSNLYVTIDEKPWQSGVSVF